MNNKWDIFISYARENREPFVMKLVTSLRILGLSVWYDEFNISPGDSIRSAIDEGIAKSRFGVVILSKAYFGKKKFWTKVELDALFTQETPNKKVICRFGMSSLSNKFQNIHLLWLRETHCFQVKESRISQKKLERKLSQKSH